METTRTCPQCQQPLSADAPDGLCPQCLMKAASDPPPSAAGDGLPGDIIDIADPAEVAKKLPQFEIIEMLGRGGMGVVYKARQLQLDRIVALKILPPVDALSPDFVARFTREARALAKLNHANIVHVYDFGEAGGLYYIIMEYVDGANLRQLQEARKLTPAEALAIVPKICDALEYAHEEGLVHRDIKPENLLIDKKGRVKIADFGLAKLLRREPLDMTLTLSGMALGTLRYMAPEQMDKPETVDHRADIYSLGVVIYEMLTGEVPVGRYELPSQKAQCDVRLDEIVLHSLEKEPARRYQHASEVRTDVEKVTSTPQVAPIAAAPASPTPTGDAARIRPRPPFVVTQPGLCNLAVISAGWAVLGLVCGAAISFWLYAYRGIPPAMMLVMLIALISVICAPITGAVAISRVRRSNGQLTGLPFATFGLLCYPMLLLAAAAFGFTHLVQIALWTKVHTGYSIDRTGHLVNSQAPPPHSYPGMSFMVLDSLVALGVCFFAGFVAWRKIAGTPDTPAKEPKHAAENDEPRLSRLALWGAIWAAVGIPMGIILALAIRDAANGAKFSGILHLPTPLFALIPISAVVGTTFLGGIAIAQIRRSGGKLYGLPLAAADLLVYPLIALGAGTFALLELAYRAVTYRWLWIPATPEQPPAYVYVTFFDLFEVFGIVVALLVCSLVAWAVWRMIVGRNADSKVASTTGPAIGLLVAGVANVAMLVAFTTAWFPEASWSQHPFICTLIAAIFLLYAVMTVLVFRGALKMLNHESYTACRVAAVCSTLSFNILSLPIGIWALVRLSKPEVKALFAKTLAEPWSAVLVSEEPGASSARTAEVQTVRMNRKKRWLAAFALVLIISFAGFAAWHFFHATQQPIFYTFYGVTDFARSPDGPVLSEAFIKKSRFTPAQVVELNKIIGAYYREFVSIERRHTDVATDARGRVHITIAPFPDESLALAQRLAAELRGVLGRKVMPQEPKQPSELGSIGLFRHCGVAEVTVELWKDGDEYHFEETHGSHPIPGGTSGGAHRGATGKNWKQVFPEEYQVYWQDEPFAGSTSPHP